MPLPIKILSTDFDGTFHSGDCSPAVPPALEKTIAKLQSQGMKWVINTGRDLPGLIEGLSRCGVAIRPDFVVVVEREIYALQESDYQPVAEWNDECTRKHAELFGRVRQHLPALSRDLQERFAAYIYEDAYSPFCLVAERVQDAEAIHDFLALFCEQQVGLTVMRNDIYARFSHVAFNKGTALTEIARRLGIGPQHIAAAGDHVNDLPMLDRAHAHWLIAPGNCVAQVREQVLRQGGHVAVGLCGEGVLEGLNWVAASVLQTSRT